MAIAKKIDHVAVAVKDLEAAVRTFTENFGLPVEHQGEVPQLNMRNAFLGIGDAALELFQPTSEQNPALRFINERGEGIYLLSLEVEQLTAAAEQLASNGIKVAVQQVGDRKIGFVSPKHTHGVLLQLVEHPGSPT
jgi:methylmalonyl-CoA/ethylmalonyl-CoA epimerase